MAISSSWGSLFMVCYCIFGVLLLAREIRKDQQENLKEARLRYEQALAKLKTDPADAYLRNNAFEMGWKYASLTRKRRGVAVFDEAALTNDINAASPGTAVSAQPTPEGFHIKITSGHKNFFDPPDDGPNVRLGVALGAALITAGAGFFVMAFMNPEE